jgi:hypothetical protein
MTGCAEILQGALEDDMQDGPVISAMKFDPATGVVEMVITDNGGNRVASKFSAAYRLAEESADVRHPLQYTPAAPFSISKYQLSVADGQTTPSWPAFPAATSFYFDVEEVARYEGANHWQNPSDTYSKGLREVWCYRDGTMTRVSHQDL